MNVAEHARNSVFVTPEKELSSTFKKYQRQKRQAKEEKKVSEEFVGYERHIMNDGVEEWRPVFGREAALTKISDLFMDPDAFIVADTPEDGHRAIEQTTGSKAYKETELNTRNY